MSTVEYVKKINNTNSPIDTQFELEDSTCRDESTEGSLKKS